MLLDKASVPTRALTTETLCVCVCVELQRNPPPSTDPNLRIFTIRGLPPQIEVARHLIDEKVGVRTRALPPGSGVAGVSFVCPRYLLPPRTSHFPGLWVLR